MKLYIGNKNYSSWSLRPWIALREKGIAFDEDVVPFDMEAGNPAFAEFSPSMKVPVLVDAGLTVWESLAIMEYAAEKFPGAGMWPQDMAMRALARAVSHEMHGGFGALRSACPMNMRREIRVIDMDSAVSKDITRIEAIWSECLERSGGPFLFGGFCNADAMYAPVVNRLEKYALSTADAVARYTASMKELPAWKEWETAALAESWIVEEDEA